MSTFPGTLFRFPLRNTPSELSEDIYTVEKLQELTGTLKREAKFLLVFLRSVDVIEIFEIGKNGKQRQVFRAAVAERDKVYKERRGFKDKLKSAITGNPYNISQNICLMLDFHVITTEGMSTTRCHWIAASQVGSSTREVLAAATKQHVLPWVGVALELKGSPRCGTSPGGRIFCFLPMPQEASCPLPVHFNGTFGLSNNRRTLKWPVGEAWNDPAAKWNALLVSQLIPPCYASLLEAAMTLLTPAQFYEAWPQVHSVSGTPWESLLLPLFRNLFRQANIWSERSDTHPAQGRWILPQNGIFIPEGTHIFSPIVHRALSNCGVKLAIVPQVIWDALNLSGVHVSVVSPSFTRGKLQNNSSCYTDLDSDSKYKLLEYCLSDDNYSNLQGLALLPLANGTFVKFGRPNLRLHQACFICSPKFPHELLPNLDERLVDLAKKHTKLHKILQKVASSGQTQLQDLSVPTIAQLLPQCMPLQWKYQQMVSLPIAQFPSQWFQTFWEWVKPHNLEYFAKELVLPVKEETNMFVTRLTTDSSVVYINYSDYCSSDLLSALKKFQVKVTYYSQFSYLQHSQLSNYVQRFTPNGVLTAAANIYKGRMCDIQHVTLTKNEASSLQTFLYSLSPCYVTTEQQEVLKHLRIFTTVNQSLTSIQQASQLSWGGMPILEPNGFNISHKCLPSNLIVLSQQNPRSILNCTGSVRTPNTPQFILDTLFVMIRHNEYPDRQINEFMEEILKRLPVLKGQSYGFTTKVGSLCFIKTAGGTRKAPQDLFDPSRSDLKELYKGEPVFPTTPFNDRQYLTHLKECGLRTSVRAQEVVSIIEEISAKQSASPCKVERIRISRAKAVLKHLSSCDNSFFNEKVTLSTRQWSTLKQALPTLATQKAWLPVHPTPPKAYPTCLVWKGRDCTSHFTSLTSQVVLDPPDQDTIRFITGSQMYVVDCSSPSVLSLLPSAPETVAQYVWEHFQRVIEHRQNIRTESLNSIVHMVYTYLQKNDSTVPDLYSSEWIWIRKHHIFVSPDMVTLGPNPTFFRSLEPYLYIRENLSRYSSLLTKCGVQQQLTQSQIVSVLRMIKDGAEEDPKQVWDIVMSILNWLTEDGQRPIPELDVTLYVPIESDSIYPQLVDIDEVVYTQNDFLKNYLASSDSEESYNFVNSRISPAMAHNLRVTPLSESMEISEDTFDDVGQHEPLMVRLKNILQDYTDGVTIIKELLQNADDAGATVVNICFDSRTHDVPSKRLLYPGMARSHGPALVVHNNASFTNEDFRNITKLAGATKMDEALKIGKFGVGFCSVYHITDIPSFLSCDLLYVFDPTMAYLGEEIRDSTRPGKKIKFTDKIVACSKQLAPYHGLYGFDGKTYYDGTMFRFPFRTATSKISSIIYDESKVTQLHQDIKTSSSELLLFLSNIKQITFSHIDEGDHTPKLLLDIKKSASDHSNDSLMCTVDIRSDGSQDREHWLVASHTDTYFSPGLKYTTATASVACCLEPASSQFDCYIPKAITGETFCFLPLPVQTGLPVHVSSNFAVMKDRRGIRSSDDIDTCDEFVKWNVTLLTEFVPEAYYNLLEVLKNMCINGEVEQDTYEFFSFWPLRESLRTHNAWDNLIQSLYTLLSSKKLFYSNSTSEWMTLAESKILASGILCKSSDEPTLTCVLEVVQKLELPIIELPDEYQRQLPQDELRACTITEEGFLKLFFENIDSLAEIQDTRNDVLQCLLKAYAIEFGQSSYFINSVQDKWYLETYLRDNECIPCTPDGTLLRKCTEVINPKAYFAKLYDPDDGKFPIDSFCGNKLVHTALLQLGIISDALPWDMLTERARSIQGLFQEDKIKALGRVKLIIRCIDKNLTSQPGVEDQLSVTCFLPVMQKPPDYPIEWYGEDYELLSGQELIQGNDNNVHLAGSQVPLVCDESPKVGGCGCIPLQVQAHLEIKSAPEYVSVIEQLKQMVTLAPDSEWTEPICQQVYTFLERELSHDRIDPGHFDKLQSLPCVWTGRMFVHPSTVALHNWQDDGPYLYRLPHALQHKPQLTSALGVKKEFSASDFLSALERIHDDFGEENVSKEVMNIISNVVRELVQCEDAELPEDITWFLPDTSNIMHKTTDLAYNDAPWCEPEANEEWPFVHKSIPRAAAIKLGVQPIRSKLLEEYESPENYEGIEFGQSEELTQRIKNILREYPLDVTVLKELLQNADDAKANKMYVILDKRTHGKKKVPSNEWKDLQGPALLVWNDSVFREEDLKGIQQLGLGSKRSEEESIGQYGIGFNVVYHLTDCPSFLSGGETLCVLDPHCRYAPGAKQLKPGRRYSNLNEKFWNRWADLKTTYLIKGTSNCPEELKGGSLFRFPLRSTDQLVKRSKLLDHEGKQKGLASRQSTTPLSARRMHDKLKGWAPDMKQALFFLNHVTELKFFEIGEDSNKMKQTHWFEANLSQDAQRSREELHARVKAFTGKSIKPDIVRYPLSLTERYPGAHGSYSETTEKWIIQQGVGDVQNSVQEWMFIPQVKPKHGIAAPLDIPGGLRAFRGKVFCFLPLPTNCNLPAHVNGNFILHASRRDLWQPTKPDDPDDRARWNMKLAEAISSSYAEFLVGAQELYIKANTYVTHKQLLDDIQHYYDVFPNWLDKGKRVPEGMFRNLAMDVYVKLSEQNACVMVTIMKQLPAEDRESSHTKHFTVEWHPLRNVGKPSRQAYFWSPLSESESQLAPILESIGMNLSVASIRFRDHLSNCGERHGHKIELPPTASSPTAFEYYTMFHQQVAPMGQFPCHIKDSAFQSVEKYRKFTKYVLKESTERLSHREYILEDSAERLSHKDYKEFPSNPGGLPLLLTADEQLRRFDMENKVIRSHYSKLFTDNQERFLHPAMLDMAYIPQYFVQPCDENWVLVHDILSTILPDSLEATLVQNANSHIQLERLSKLWDCLASDPVFSYHLKSIVGTWALLPSTTNQLFSFRSWNQLLPVIPPRTREQEFSLSLMETPQPEVHRQVFQVLQQIGMPQLNTAIVSRHTASPFCPDFSNPEIILSNLYYLHTLHSEECLTSLKTDRNADRKIRVLFDYFRTINFNVDDNSLHKMKSLPLFRNMDGRLCTLLGQVYLWPGHICKVGFKKCLQQTLAVFLKDDDAWTKLGPAGTLGIQLISPLVVCTTFIFPYFHLLSESEKIAQLQHIRDVLFPDANLDKDYKNFARQSDAVRFIAALEDLPCLPQNGVLKPVRDFCDPKVPIFTTFPATFYPPPVRLIEDKWLVFFRKIGLRTKITQTEFKTFCQQVSEGKHRELRQASEVLLKYLFKAKEWYECIKFLEEVSQISFVCTEKPRLLDWINPVQSAENRIQQGRKITDMTRLHGAALYRDRELLWTVKPVVKLPGLVSGALKEISETFYETLGVLTDPETNDVVKNILNISQSRFSSFHLFDKYTTDCQTKQEGGRCLLVDVMKANFEYLQKPKEGVLDSLRSVPCIPVCAEGQSTDIRNPVLVMPSQVIATPADEVKKLRPFLNALPADLFPLLQVLSDVGVQNSIKPIHIRVALETVHNHVNQPLDLNTGETVRHLLKKLFSLLQGMGEVQTVGKVGETLKPLYLPNKENEMVGTTSLLWVDKVGYKRTHFDLSGLDYSLFSLLCPDPRSDIGFTERQFCRCLPLDVSPQPLSTCCEEVLHESCTERVETPSLFAKKLQTSFTLPIFPRAAKAILLSNGNNKEVCSKFAASLEQFLQHTEIVVMKQLQADVYLKLVHPAHKIGTAKVDFLLQNKGGSFKLYLDENTHALRPNLIESLTSLIVLCVAQMSDIDHKTLQEPEKAISILLQAETADQVIDLLEQLDVALELDRDDLLDHNFKPKLGEPIPESLHHLLEQDMNHIFRPEEWVGYEEREDHIVFARIVHRILEEEENSDEPYDKYRIYTQEDDEDGKVVSVLDLYKFVRTEPQSKQESQEVVPLDTDSDAAHLRAAFPGDELGRIKREICEELRRIWRLPEDQRKKAIKRLYLKWHPDKNEHPFATKAFQYLQHQIARLLNGLPLEELDMDEDTKYEPPPSWRSWCGAWDGIARRHRRARDKGYGGGGGGGWGMGGFGGWFTLTPEPETAKVWIKQVEVDMKVLGIVLQQVETFPEVSGHVCFLAHEVAERALKAGKYATCGLHPESLRYHSLTGHAGALQQERPSLTPGLQAYAGVLEGYYVKTRYPNQYAPHSVPADHFTPDQAKDAGRIARLVFDMMKRVVEQWTM